MTSSIPASAIVSVTPGVLATGGSGLNLSGLILTKSDTLPAKRTIGFSSQTAVANYFGSLSLEANLAARYFGGFNGSSIRPGNLIFYRYLDKAAKAFLRGGSLANLTLTQLQALSGTIIVDINGLTVTSPVINLTSASSYSAAAALIEAGLNNSDASFTGAISGTTLTVTAVASGELVIGQELTGSGVVEGTTIDAFLTGTGGVGTYTVSTSQTVTSTGLKSGRTKVTYDSQFKAFVITGGTPGANQSISFATGTLSALIGLTQATGAIQSIGQAPETPTIAMDFVIDNTQNFASFMTAFKPSVLDMVEFAQWTNAQKDRFLYAMWDNDITVTTQSDTPNAGSLIQSPELSGIFMIYDPIDGASLAAFAMGSIASIDFDRTEDRTNLAFLSQSGITPGVTNKSIGDQLQINGYNFYAAYATANDQFKFMYPGIVTGPFKYADTYVNQIWLNNSFQLALMQLLTSTRSIPYNPSGYALIEASLLNSINDAIDFGAIRAGVELSDSQVVDLNTAAGRDIAQTIEQRGWYLLIQPASPIVRTNRGSPPITFWYTDGQSVQSINLNSVEVQ